MLDRKEIDIEIARLEYGESSYPAYAKLADLYAIRDQMDKETPVQTPPVAVASYSAAPSIQTTPRTAERYGDSDFLSAISGKDLDSVFGVVDDLMDTLHTVNPRVYENVMRKIRSIP